MGVVFLVLDECRAFAHHKRQDEMKKIPHFEKSAKFVLHYTDWDHYTTTEVTHNLNATNRKDAVHEARNFLTSLQDIRLSGLPKQKNGGKITQGHHFNIDDLRIGPKAKAS